VVLDALAADRLQQDLVQRVMLYVVKLKNAVTDILVLRKLPEIQKVALGD
jgi:hypothetical protein